MKLEDFEQSKKLLCFISTFPPVNLVIHIRAPLQHDFEIKRDEKKKEWRAR